MLLGAIALSLMFWKPAFMVIVAIAVVVAIWELGKGLQAQDIDLPEQPLMLGGVVMVVVAYYYGAPALVTATAVTALVTMLWLLRRGHRRLRQERHRLGVHRRLRPVPRPRSSRCCWPRAAARAPASTTTGVAGVITFILVTIASDTGGYAAGVLFGKHPMAPVISPKKSWEGFVGSVLATVGAGVVLVVYLLEGDWWVGVALGLIAAVMATLGDLCESVIKRDLGHQGHEPGHPRARRPDGPPGLAARHGRPDLAAAPLRGVLSASPYPEQ